MGRWCWSGSSSSSGAVPSDVLQPLLAELRSLSTGCNVCWVTQPLLAEVTTWGWGVVRGGSEGGAGRMPVAGSAPGGRMPFGYVSSAVVCRSLGQRRAVVCRSRRSEPGGDRVADGGRGPGSTGGARALGEVGRHGCLYSGRLGGEAEVVQEHGYRQDRRRRVGLALACDIGRRAVHRLEHAGRRPRRVDVATRRETDATGDGRGDVG